MDEFDLMPTAALAPELEERVRSELREGERLIWFGQPLFWNSVRGTLPVVLFGVPWTAFSFIWMAGALSFTLFGDGPEGGMGIMKWVFPLFGLPFVAVGLAMVSAPLWAWRLAKQTCYALTNERVIIWKAFWFGQLEIYSLAPKDMNRIYRIENADGSGDLILREVVTPSTAGSTTVTRLEHRGIFAVREVRKLEQVLREVLPVNGDHTQN